MLNSQLSQAVKLFSPKVTEMIAEDSSFNIADLISQKNSEVQKFESYCSTVRILLEHCESVPNGILTMYIASYVEVAHACVCTALYAIYNKYIEQKIWI